MMTREDGQRKETDQRVAICDDWMKKGRSLEFWNQVIGAALASLFAGAPGHWQHNASILVLDCLFEIWSEIDDFHITMERMQSAIIYDCVCQAEVSVCSTGGYHFNLFLR